MNYLLNIARFLCDSSATDAADTASGALAGVTNAALATFKSVMKILLPFIFSVVTLIGVVYCVILGVNYAKQDKTDKREEAKKQLVGAIVGFGIAIVASAILWALNGAGIFDSLFK